MVEISKSLPPLISLIDPMNPNFFYHNQMIWFKCDSKEILMFDFFKKNWISGLNLDDFLFPSYFRTAQLEDSSVIITGGSDNKDVIINEVINYLPNGHIVKRQGMLNARRAHCSIYNNGFVYVFGGVHNQGFLELCEKYDVRKDHWVKIEKMSKKRSLTSCCNVNNDSIFVFGGYSEEENIELDLIERYDVLNDKFYVLSYKMHERLQNPLVVQINYKNIIIFGGYSDKVQDSSQVILIDIYDGSICNYKNFDNKGGWSMYPLIYNDGTICLFINGEDANQPEFVEYDLKI